MRSLTFLLFIAAIGFQSCKSTEKKMQGPKGEFLVKSVKNDSVSDKKMTMIFNYDKGQVSGTAVCNTYSATYVISGKNIKFSPAISTKMMCPEGTNLEYNFFQALLKADSYTLKRGNLKLLNAAEMVILTAQDN